MQSWQSAGARRSWPSFTKSGKTRTLVREQTRGGNDVKVTFFENRTNLHSLWDSGMIRRTKKGWTEYATELAAKITPQERIQYSTLDPAVWATESHRLAHSNAYDVPKDGRLGQDYFDKNSPVIERRLSVAGVRLAVLLNVIFDETKELPFGVKGDRSD